MVSIVGTVSHESCTCRVRCGNFPPSSWRVSEVTYLCIAKWVNDGLQHYGAAHECILTPRHKSQHLCSCGHMEGAA